MADIGAKRLARLVGSRHGKKALVEALPYLGLDIESIEGDSIRVEYSPNRPDYSTDYGIAEGLRGMLGVRTGAQKVAPKPGARYAIRTSPRLARIRPVIMGVFARRMTLDDDALRQLIAMQEDLHAGIGRHRRKASIGIHDADQIAFPLQYTTAPKDAELVPLGSKDALGLGDILTKTDVGAKYAPLLEGHSAMPVLCGADGRIISFPPIINSAHTALTSKTRQIFVEVTGTDPHAVGDVLSVVAFTLASAGAELFEARTRQSSGLGPRRMALRPGLVNETLGLDLGTKQIISCLRRSRLDAVKSGTRISCQVPRHRFDILGEMDLIEEVALGYGIANIAPELPPQESSGQISSESAMQARVSACMVGLGYTEALNSALVAGPSPAEPTLEKRSKPLSVIEPGNRSTTVLRDSLIAGLFDVLSRNVHEPYPQCVYEIGTVFSRASPVDEHTVLGAVVAHKDASYTQAKSAAVAMLQMCFGASPSTPASSHPALKSGHTADIVIGKRRVGVIGEASRESLEMLRLRQPVAVFELDLGAAAKICGIANN